MDKNDKNIIFKYYKFITNYNDFIEDSELYHNSDESEGYFYQTYLLKIPENDHLIKYPYIIKVYYGMLNYDYFVYDNNDFKSIIQLNIDSFQDYLEIDYRTETLENKYEILARYNTDDYIETKNKLNNVFEKINESNSDKSVIKEFYKFIINNQDINLDDFEENFFYIRLYKNNNDYFNNDYFRYKNYDYMIVYDIRQTTVYTQSYYYLYNNGEFINSENILSDYLMTFYERIYNMDQNGTLRSNFSIIRKINSIDWKDFKKKIINSYRKINEENNKVSALYLTNIRQKPYISNYGIFNENKISKDLLKDFNNFLDEYTFIDGFEEEFYIMKLNKNINSDGNIIMFIYTHNNFDYFKEICFYNNGKFILNYSHDEILHSILKSYDYSKESLEDVDIVDKVLLDIDKETIEKIKSNQKNVMRKLNESESNNNFEKKLIKEYIKFILNHKDFIENCNIEDIYPISYLLKIERKEFEDELYDAPPFKYYLKIQIDDEFYYYVYDTVNKKFIDTLEIEFNGTSLWHFLYNIDTGVNSLDFELDDIGETIYYIDKDKYIEISNKMGGLMKQINESNINNIDTDNDTFIKKLKKKFIKFILDNNNDFMKHDSNKIGELLYFPEIILSEITTINFKKYIDDEIPDKYRYFIYLSNGDKIEYYVYLDSLGHFNNTKLIYLHGFKLYDFLKESNRYDVFENMGNTILIYDIYDIKKLYLKVGNTLKQINQ